MLPHDIDHDQPKNMTWLEYLVSGGDLKTMTILQDKRSGPDPHFSRADMLRAAKAELDRYKRLVDQYCELVKYHMGICRVICSKELKIHNEKCIVKKFNLSGWCMNKRRLIREK